MSEVLRKCGIEATSSYVELYILRAICNPPLLIDSCQVLGDYALGGCYSDFPLYTDVNITLGVYTLGGP